MSQEANPRTNASILGVPRPGLLDLCGGAIDSIAMSPIHGLLVFDTKINLPRLKVAAGKLLSRLPVLNCELVSGKDGNHWQPLASGLTPSQFVHLVEVPGSATATRRLITEAVLRIVNVDEAPHSGPLFRIFVLRARHHDVLLLRIKHVVADAAAFKELVYLLAAEYNGSSRVLASEKLGKLSAYERLLEKLDPAVFEKAEQHRAIEDGIHRNLEPVVQVEFPDLDQPALVSLRLDKAFTRKMRKAAAEFGGDAGDLILAAYCRTLNEFRREANTSRILISTTHDLRRYLGYIERRAIANLSLGNTTELQHDPSTSMTAFAQQVVSWQNEIRSLAPAVSSLVRLQETEKLTPAALLEPLLRNSMKSVYQTRLAPAVFNYAGKGNMRLAEFSGATLLDLTSVTPMPRSKYVMQAIVTLAGGITTARIHTRDGGAPGTISYQFVESWRRHLAEISGLEDGAKQEVSEHLVPEVSK